MTLEEVWELKTKVEADLLVMVRHLEEATGLEIAGLELLRLSTTDGPRPLFRVEADVRLRAPWSLSAKRG